MTDLGRLFLPRARQILALVDEASRTSLQGQNTSGAVTIGVSYTVMGYFLPYHIQRLSTSTRKLNSIWLKTIAVLLKKSY